MIGWIKRRLKKPDDPKAQLKEVLGDFQLPTFPLVANRALTLLRDPNVSLTAAGDALAEDPALSSRVLQLANSSAFATRHAVRSVGHAASLMGRGQLESVILTAVVGKVLPAPSIASFDTQRFWRAAARRACTARSLAALVHPKTKSETFTASLLGDMAIPLLGQAHGARYGAVYAQWHADGGCLARLEREALGFDHANVAGWVAESWKFPQPLTDAIGAHHDGASDGDAVGPAIGLVAPLGELDDPRSIDEVVEGVASRFGMPTDTVLGILEASRAEADDIAARMT
ncbi:MAG: HDOD domain-containing protein [Sandaracinaceae bacterium]